MITKKVITIDGPAGSGKSTVAKLVAKRLGLNYLDTGAMYRALTWASLEAKIDLSNNSAILAIAESMDLNISYQNGKLSVYLKGKDVSDAIRLPLVNESISRISEVPEVRDIMVSKQRELAKSGAVVEGRDIGTVVFPDAEYKFYIDADFDIRVERRYKEMQAKELDLSRDDVSINLSKRDISDKNRLHGPLVKAEDAIVIDTTGMSIDDVVDKILSYLGDKNDS
ncbi:MAG: (d)CMP kinase [Candidatus Kaelpia aquatica]|nr:(d)CMP kinase [Candidatus Kaelpia aquatica]